LTSSTPKILVYGAGAIGGYLGGTLLAAGLDVTLLGRERIQSTFGAQGLTLTDFEGREAVLDAGTVPFCTTLANQQPVDIVLLTVKCTGLEQAAKDLAPWVHPETLVVCCQNGIGTREIVAAHLEAVTISAMVAFNVAWPDKARLHRGTDGKLILQDHPGVAPLIDAWRTMGVPAGTTDRFTDVAWGKLMLNLNNAVNALAGVPLLEQLNDRNYRTVLSRCQRELLSALRKAGIRPALLTKAPPFLIPWILLLPNWLFKIVARQMLEIDPLARSSMWEDLESGRKTEIDFLNQAVVELAFQQGLTAPVNERLVEIVRQAERSEAGSPKISGKELVSAVG
jgi:2-dehydropantoate 2-reductase